MAACNLGDGIVIVGASGNTVGGTKLTDRNVISANGLAGVRIEGGQDGSLAANNMVQGNIIGTFGTGDPATLGNTDGVSIAGGASNNIIGATTLGPALGGATMPDPASNIIAGNNQEGVLINASSTASATGNRISQNQIFDSGYMGIDLGDDGITAPNDHAGASGLSPDNWQSYPIIYNVTDTSLSFFVAVPGAPGGPTAVGIAGPTYNIEFYANTSADVMRLSEGGKFLGSATALGNQLVTLPFTSSAIDAQFLTTIAIDPNGNTSEFSPCRDLLRDSVKSGKSSNLAADPAQIVLFFVPNNLPAAIPPGNGAADVALQRAAQICDVDHFN